MQKFGEVEFRKHSGSILWLPSGLKGRGQ